MKVSVAMTTYNGEKYVISQLDSLLNQSRKIDEVIICDDRSTDKTVELIENYIKEHKLNSWSVRRNETNLGFIENFRQAISLTSGDIIFLSDQDDEWKLKKIEIMVETMCKNTDIEVLMSSINFIDGQGNEIHPSSSKKWFTRMKESKEGSLIPVDYIEICSENFAPGCTMCFSRKIADEYLSFDNKAGIYHDWLISLLGARTSSLYMLFVPLINYRLHSNNAIGMTVGKPIRTYENDLRRIEGMKNRIMVGINSSYRNNERLQANLKYTQARLELYTGKSMKKLLNVIYCSFNAKDVTRSKVRTNLKDIMFYLNVLYK